MASTIRRVHSRAEVVQLAYLLDALGRLDELREVLRRGDATQLSDGALTLDDHLLVYEYDPGWYHPPERDDAKKTHELLSLGNDVLVLRTRVDAVPLDVQDARYVEVHASSRDSPGAVLAKEIDKIAPYLSALTALRLTTCGGAHRRRHAEIEAQTVYNEIYPGAAELARRIRRTLEDHELGTVDESTLTGTPLETIQSAATYLTATLGIEPKKIAAYPNLLSCSVEDNLKPTVAYLTQTLGIEPKKIAAHPNLLSCSVEDNLKPTVAYLTQTLGMELKKIAAHPNLLSYSVDTNLAPTYDWIRSVFPMYNINADPAVLTCSLTRMKRAYDHMGPSVTLRKVSRAKVGFVGAINGDSA